jgi:predicted ATPase
VSTKSIKYLRIRNFKSIDILEIKDGLSPFAAFAGPNGSGKSNFFDALDFVRIFMESGVEAALRSHGRFENIHSEKRKAKYARRFDFQIIVELSDNRKEPEGETAIFDYELNIHEIDNQPKVEEKLLINDKPFLIRPVGKEPKFYLQKSNQDKSESSDASKENHENTSLNKRFPENYSALLFVYALPLAELLRNIRLYRIDPLGAKETNQSDKDPDLLDKKGHNLASVLSRLEKDEERRSTILEWMELIVPGVEIIKTDRQTIDSKTAILFKELGTRRHFPAHMVSDGTIYALAMLVAVLDRPSGFGLTLIEEPERGLHPKAIRELVGFIRDNASPDQPVWLSTHSESVVRQLRLNELVLVDKEDGRTRMKTADSGNLTQENLAPLGVDEAWLSNLLSGGVPW